MISDMTKANILITIAGGKSVAEGAKPYGLSSAQARGALPRFCQHLKLRWDLEDLELIHKNILMQHQLYYLRQKIPSEGCCGMIWYSS
tara:strand:- start:343 stop:606 length:264 start_codon:yes stop_codon:yes gene_type:complete